MVLYFSGAVPKARLKIGGISEFMHCTLAAPRSGGLKPPFAKVGGLKPPLLGLSTSSRTKNHGLRFQYAASPPFFGIERQSARSTISELSRLCDVPRNLRGEGLDVLEFLFGSEIAQKSNLDFFAIDVSVQVEQVELE